MSAVDGADIQHDINHIRAQLVCLHVDGIRIGGDIDLADKPAWFLALSPTGKTPLLMVGATHALFEVLLKDKVGFTRLSSTLTVYAAPAQPNAVRLVAILFLVTVTI